MLNTKTRQIWRLTYRYQRLLDQAERVRGNCINLAWFAVADNIYKTLDQLEALGVDLNTLTGDGKWQQAQTTVERALGIK